MPGESKPEHGYYRDCCQRFTKHLDLLKSSTENSKTIKETRTCGRSSKASEKVMFKPDRIFSDKEGRQKIKEKGVWTTEATEVSECRGWKKVLETTENKKDTELLRGSEVLIYLHVKHVFTAAVAGSI